MSEYERTTTTTTTNAPERVVVRRESSAGWWIAALVAIVALVAVFFIVSNNGPTPDRPAGRPRPGRGRGEPGQRRRERTAGRGHGGPGRPERRVGRRGRHRERGPGRRPAVRTGRGRGRRHGERRGRGRPRRAARRSRTAIEREGAPNRRLLAPSVSSQWRSRSLEEVGAAEGRQDLVVDAFEHLEAEGRPRRRGRPRRPAWRGSRGRRCAGRTSGAGPAARRWARPPPTPRPGRAADRVDPGYGLLLLEVADGLTAGGACPCARLLASARRSSQFYPG